MARVRSLTNSQIAREQFARRTHSGLPMVDEYPGVRVRPTCEVNPVTLDAMLQRRVFRGLQDHQLIHTGLDQILPPCSPGSISEVTDKVLRMSAKV